MIYDPEATLADPSAPLIHKVYASINIGIRDRGEQWAKCANCGELYQITEQWSDETVCSQGCFDTYLAYVQNPELF